MPQSVASVSHKLSCVYFVLSARLVGRSRRNVERSICDDG